MFKKHNYCKIIDLIMLQNNEVDLLESNDHITAKTAALMLTPVRGLHQVSFYTKADDIDR